MKTNEGIWRSTDEYELLPSFTRARMRMKRRNEGAVVSEFDMARAKVLVQEKKLLLQEREKRRNAAKVLIRERKMLREWQARKSGASKSGERKSGAASESGGSGRTRRRWRQRKMQSMRVQLQVLEAQFSSLVKEGMRNKERLEEMVAGEAATRYADSAAGAKKVKVLAAKSDATDKECGDELLAKEAVVKEYGDELLAKEAAVERCVLLAKEAAVKEYGDELLAKEAAVERCVLLAKEAAVKDYGDELLAKEAAVERCALLAKEAAVERCAVSKEGAEDTIEMCAAAVTKTTRRRPEAAEHAVGEAAECAVEKAAECAVEKAAECAVGEAVERAVGEATECAVGEAAERATRHVGEGGVGTVEPAVDDLATDNPFAYHVIEFDWCVMDKAAVCATKGAAAQVMEELTTTDDEQQKEWIRDENAAVGAGNTARCAAVAPVLQHSEQLLDRQGATWDAVAATEGAPCAPDAKVASARGGGLVRWVFQGGHSGISSAAGGSAVNKDTGVYSVGDGHGVQIGGAGGVRQCTDMLVVQVVGVDALGSATLGEIVQLVVVHEQVVGLNNDGLKVKEEQLEQQQVVQVVQLVGDRLDGEQHDCPEGRLDEERPQQPDQQVGLDNEELEEEQQVQLDEWQQRGGRQKQRLAVTERHQERLGERPWLQPLTGIGGVAEELPTATARPPGGG
jgi:hypothetical protein